MAKQLKYIAAYLTAPTSAITHYAPIRSIEPWQNTGKMVINFRACTRDHSTQADEDWPGTTLAGIALYELREAEEGDQFGRGILSD